MILLMKFLKLLLRTIFVDPEQSLLVVVDVTHSSDKSFKLVVVYVPCKVN